jgi:hypothetical protein
MKGGGKHGQMGIVVPKKGKFKGCLNLPLGTDGACKSGGLRSTAAPESAARWSEPEVWGLLVRLVDRRAVACGNVVGK